MKSDKKEYTWRTVNMTPENKKLVQELSVAMGNEYCPLPMSTVLEILVKAKHKELFG